MIFIAFPQEVRLWSGEEEVRRFMRFLPAAKDRNGNLLLDRVYVTVEENLRNLEQHCIDQGIQKPAQLKDSLFSNLKTWPKKIEELLREPRPAGNSDRTLRLCMINGGGGGLGDGIMFAPAIEILQRLLAQKGYRDVAIDAYSLLPHRTCSVIGRIPNLRVRPIPLPLAEFLSYDAYADFTNMLEDEIFQHSHMTDFALIRMGISPETIKTRYKIPFLNIPGSRPPEIRIALETARRLSGGRPLIAVIFSASRIRRMPLKKASDIIRKISLKYQPVIIMPDAAAAEKFISRHELRDRVVDLSSSSTNFMNYIMLLSGMDGIVSVDTSAVHIGAAFNIPTVAIFNAINKEHRISYSPSVRGIQIEYQGQRCQAPCGLSKSSAYLRGNLKNIRPFYMEFNYACDEAVDRDALLSQAKNRLLAINPHQDLEHELEKIQREYERRFDKPDAPCWKALHTENVITVLDEILDATDKATVPCPICSTEDYHRLIGRRWGRRLMFCRNCHAEFLVPSQDAEPFSRPSSIISRLYDEEIDFMANSIKHLLKGSKKILWVRSLDTIWSGILSRLSRHVEGRSITEINQADIPSNTITDNTFDLILAPGICDTSESPMSLLRNLSGLLAERGLLYFSSFNCDSIVYTSGLAGALTPVTSPLTGCTAKTHKKMAGSLGLNHCCTVTTPFAWSFFTEIIGTPPPVRIQPPDSPGTIIELSGQDQDSISRSHYMKLCSEITEQGRFLLTLAAKKSEREKNDNSTKTKGKA